MTQNKASEGGGVMSKSNSKPITTFIPKVNPPTSENPTPLENVPIVNAPKHTTPQRESIGSQIAWDAGFFDQISDKQLRDMEKAIESHTQHRINEVLERLEEHMRSVYDDGFPADSHYVVDFIQAERNRINKEEKV